MSFNSKEEYDAYSQGMAELEAEQEAMAAEAEAEEKNKDLEIIKSQVHSFATCDIEYADALEMEKAIIDAAQRMADEIERLEKELAALREKQPVTCGECKYNSIVDGYPYCHKLRMAPCDYCGHARRKEVPDGK